MIPGPLTSNAYVGFEVVNSPFDVRSYFIEGSPFRGIPLDAEEHTEFHVFISVSSPAFLCSRAVGFAVIDPLAFVHMDFGAAPFDLVRTVVEVARKELEKAKGEKPVSQKMFRAI